MTHDLPEPRNVGPIAGGDLRASDADREQVLTLLRTAYAEGRLTLDEHDERAGQVIAARTFDDLVPLTADLVAQAGTPARPTGEYQLDTTGSTPVPDRMVAVFGAVSRAGRWRVRRSIQALVLFGGMDLDLRQAVFESDLVEISGFWCFGGCDIKVPAGVEVRDQVSGIFGGSEVRDVGDKQPGAPTVVVKGVVLFGGVSVKGPKTGHQGP